LTVLRKRAHDPTEGSTEKTNGTQIGTRKMDEDRFNISVRKFLKEVGVTSQREIEKAVRDALASGRLHDDTQLEATMTLQIPALGLIHIVDGLVDVG
jgi:hypothetical protein